MYDPLAPASGAASDPARDSASRTTTSTQTTRLGEFITKHGPVLSIKGRQLTITAITCRNGMALASAAGKRATFTAVRCEGSRLAGDKSHDAAHDAEIWSVINGRGNTVVDFAIRGDQCVALA